MFKVSLVLSCMAALCAAWQPGARDICNPLMVMGGSYVLPHERYCQVFLSCDTFGRQYMNLCPNPSLFAYGDGVSTCAVLGSTAYTCPKWPCSEQAHIGRNYPDVCCKKYWTCERIGKFAQRECGAGETFNMAAEVCQSESRPTDVCNDDVFCLDPDFRSPFANNRPWPDCPNSPVDGDSCSYRTDGFPGIRKCPAGTSYKHSDCSCTQFAEQCSFQVLTKADFNIQKQPDNLCRASGRMDMSKNPLMTLSYKLPAGALDYTPVDHYYMNRTVGFTQNGIDFNGNGALIYDYFYADNILYAPLAISLTVKFTRPSAGFVQGTNYYLLENVFFAGNTKYCNDPTIGIGATYSGLVGGQNQWKFTLVARGIGATSALTATTEGDILGGADDHYRVIFYYNDNLSGSVQNVGASGRSPGQKVNFDPSTVSLGRRLGTNKCGFSIGRDLLGRMTEFQVFEGCVNPQNQNLAGIPS